MLKKFIILGVLLCSILLVGCNGESEVVVLDLEDRENVETLTLESVFFPELRYEIINSITEQTEIDSESINSMMLGGNFKEMSISIGIPKDVMVDERKIQQIVIDAIKKVSEKEKITIDEEDITIIIEKY